MADWLVLQEETDERSGVRIRLDGDEVLLQQKSNDTEWENAISVTPIGSFVRDLLIAAFRAGMAQERLGDE